MATTTATQKPSSTADEEREEARRALQESMNRRQ
jgi:hypothetical protein